MVAAHDSWAPRGRLSRGRFALPTTAANRIELRSPARPAEVVAVLPLGDDDVADVVDSAAGAFPAWECVPVAARAHAVARIEAALVPMFGELSRRMEQELGRPPWECRRELAGLVPRLRDLVDHAREHLGDARTGGTCVRRRSLGAVAILGPVMFPIATSHASIVAALLAGNTVVWKPSPLAAASAQLYAEALASAGLPPGVFNLVHGGAAVGEQLLLHPRIEGAVFVGSRANALEVRRATASRLDLRTILHVGGKNAAVVLADADVDATVAALVHGAFATAGQRSTAIGRVLVEASLLHELVDKLDTLCGRLRAAPPGPGTSFGPMFSRDRVDRFLQRLATAEADGAVAVRPARARDGSCLVEPSIHVVEDQRVATAYRDEELFGPDVVVEPVANLEEAIERLRGRSTLYTACFTRAHRSWRRFTDAVRSGAVLWNHAPDAVSARVPFAAVGRDTPARGVPALLAMTREAAVCDAPSGTPLRFPDPEDHR